MLAYARERFPQATFVKEDVAEYLGPDGRRYDRVVFNACFGNLFDPLAVLRHVSRNLLADGGLIVISHPLGRDWLRGLQKRDPQMVLHDLPGHAEVDQMLKEVPELSVELLEDETDYYCLVLRWPLCSRLASGIRLTVEVNAPDTASQWLLCDLMKIYQYYWLGKDAEPGLPRSADRVLRQSFLAIKSAGLQKKILDCVTSLYRSETKPYLGEVQKLLRVAATTKTDKDEARYVAAVCALKPELFLLVPPFCGNPPCILLRDPPTGFELWYEKLPQRCSQTPEEEAMRNLRESISAGRLSTMRKVIDELYADRIEPTLNEVQERLRDRGWSYSDAQQAVLLYACQKDTYDLTKPTQNKQIVVLLKEPPRSFAGWAEGAGIIPKVSTTMESGFKSLLAAGRAPALRGGVAGAAQALQNISPQGSLGELRALLRVFILRGLLEYRDDELVPTVVLLKDLDTLRQAPPRTPERKKSPGRIYSQI
ncbi:unnamed protein product [Symbiodinium sp. CCMP2592]|nr:unnamed protein product [Symbiodinium sp. CCMP2592]